MLRGEITSAEVIYPPVSSVVLSSSFCTVTYLAQGYNSNNKVKENNLF